MLFPGSRKLVISAVGVAPGVALNRHPTAPPGGVDTEISRVFAPNAADAALTALVVIV